MEVVGADAVRLRDQLYAPLNGGVRDAIARIIDVGGGDVYAVGGVVRDLLLGRQIHDVDLVCEGDAIARVRAALPDEHLTTHTQFGTVSVAIEGTRLDAATARRESYRRTGALPTVEGADIGADLQRRDFSINAMALRLTGDAVLLDPCGGLADIAAWTIRVLHAGSFRDDPTRVFRAFRYASRLGFRLDARTDELLRTDVSSIAHVTGARIRQELALMFGESSGGEALEAADDAGALVAVHQHLGWNPVKTSALAARASDIPLLEYGFALLTADATDDQAPAIVDRLRLRSDEAAAVSGLASMRVTAATLHRSGAKPSGVTLLLDRYPASSVAAFAATSGDQIAGPIASRYLAEWRSVKPLLRGNDLVALGVPEGPHIHRGLQLIRAARLDGWADDEDDERALALRFATSIRDSGVARAGVELQVHGH